MPLIPPTADSSEYGPWSVALRLAETPELLREIADSREPELALQKRLRKLYPDDLVRGGLTLMDLRRRAAAKFTRAERMWFDRRGLEQATSEAVARHKAVRFAEASHTGRIYDLCSGIGGDAISLAALGPVVAVDANPVAGLYTHRNAEVYGVADRVEIETASVESVSFVGELVHFDPDRRVTKATRAVRIEEYSPGLEFMQHVTSIARGGAIKLSPAANFGGKFPRAEVELVSFRGECKEATIWFGDLRTDADWRATVLPSGQSLSGDPLRAISFQGPIAEFLLDPDPAVVRSGLVDVLAETEHFERLDRDEEFLTTNAETASPFVTSFRVLDVLPNHVKDLAVRLRELGAGSVEILCRRIPVDVESVRTKLKLAGGGLSLCAIFARIEGKAQIVIAERVSKTN